MMRLILLILVSALFPDQVIPESNKGPAYLYPANAEDRLYRLPFTQGKTFPITDGYWSDPGQVNHQDYSLDWTMPAMEPLLCARAGRVMSIRVTDSVCVIKGSEGNYVVIGHVDSVPDASRPSGYRKLWIRDWYQHLHYNIPVKIGDQVAQGQVIGYNWCSGKSEEGPHLHFEVNMDGHEGTGLGGRTVTSIPVPFVEVDAHNGFPEVGETWYSENVLETAIEQRPSGEVMVRVFPNPVVSAFCVFTPNDCRGGSRPAPTLLSIYNTNGRMMHQSSINNSQTINTHTWSAGIYLLKINTGATVHTRRLMVIK